MTIPRLRGSMVALVTPMRADGEIDLRALEELIDWHVEQGTAAIVAVGTTGESATLDFDEHIRVIEKAAQFLDGRIPLIAGTGANATREAIALTRDARRAGADACLLVTPYYNRPTQEGLYRHYCAVAEASDAPLILYNVPARTAVDMLPETCGRLAHLPSVAGIKEATGDVQRGREVMAAMGPGALVLSGDDASAMELMLAGAHGTISVTANVAPKLMALMCEAACNGESERARQLNDALDPLHQALFLEPNPIPVKWALADCGRIGEGIRLPMTPLSEPLREEVRRAARIAEERLAELGAAAEAG